MKKKDVILDFTSLLDVTLIVIFFFVLFSHLDSQENKKLTDTKIQELEVAIQDAEQRETEADAMINQLDSEISKVIEYRKRQEISGMLEFNRSENVKIILDMDTDDWSIRVIKGDLVINNINSGADIGNEIKKALFGAQYDNSKTIFCDLVFDGSLPGTASAYRIIKQGIEEVSKEYKCFYLSETDLSIGGE